MLVQQVVPEFCYPKLGKKLCAGVCVGGAWVEIASTLKVAAGHPVLSAVCLCIEMNGR